MTDASLSSDPCPHCAASKAQLEVMHQALMGAVSRAQWQSITNRELNALRGRMRELEAQLPKQDTLGGSIATRDPLLDSWGPSA